MAALQVHLHGTALPGHGSGSPLAAVGAPQGLPLGESPLAAVGAPQGLPLGEPPLAAVGAPQGLPLGESPLVDPGGVLEPHDHLAQGGQ